MNLLQLTTIATAVCVLWPAYSHTTQEEAHPESARCSCNRFASSPATEEGFCSSLEHKRGFGSAKHAIIIGLDGLGSLYLENATSFLPNIASFFAEGSTTLRGRCQMPAWSAPNWAAVITGMGPEESGVRYNTWTPPRQDKTSDSTASVLPPISGAGKIPETMWRVAKQQRGQLVTAVAHAWDWIHYLVEPDTVDMEVRGHGNDTSCIDAMCGFIVRHRPHLMFLHLDGVDVSGHAYYWGSPEYYSASKAADGYVGRVMAALAGAGLLNDTLVILTADHGGFRDNHGDFNEANIFVPVLLRGPGVRRGHALSRYVSNRDIAPSMLHALGLLPGQYMVGRVLEEAFE